MMSKDDVRFKKQLKCLGNAEAAQSSPCRWGFVAGCVRL